MNKSQTDAALELLDNLKYAAERLESAAANILDAIGAAEENLLGDGVDPTADRSDLIGSDLAEVESMAFESEGAVLDIREMLSA
jgi:hypothetical protein